MKRHSAVVLQVGGVRQDGKLVKHALPQNAHCLVSFVPEYMYYVNYYSPQKTLLHEGPALLLLKKRSWPARTNPCRCRLRIRRKTRSNFQTQSRRSTRRNPYCHSEAALSAEALAKAEGGGRGCANKFIPWPKMIGSRVMHSSSIKLFSRQYP